MVIIIILIPPVTEVANLLQNVQLTTQIANTRGEKKRAGDLTTITRPRLTKTNQLEIVLSPDTSRGVVIIIILIPPVIGGTNLLQNVDETIQIADALGEMKTAGDLTTITRPRLTETNQLEIGFIGLIKAGKSSTLNALIGREILPVSTQPQTAADVYIVHDSNKPNGQLFGTEYRSNQSNFICKGVPDIRAYLCKLNETIRNEESLLKAQNEGKVEFMPGAKRPTVATTGQEPPKKQQKGTSQCRSYSKLILHVRVPFLAQMQDLPVSISISDAAGTNEAGMGNRDQKSALVVNRLTAFVVLLNYRALKSISEEELIQQLQEHHPQLLDSKQFDRILFLVNQVDAYYEEGNDDSENPETVPAYVADYLNKNLGVDVPQASIIPFSAKWALNARKWSACLATMTQLDFMTATVFLKKAQQDESETIPKATEKNKSALCTALEKWSGILAVEERLREMFHKCTQILQMSVLDDTTKHIVAISAIIQQRRAKAENKDTAITSQEKMIGAVQKLVDDSIRNLATIARPQVNTILAGLEHSISGVITTTVSGHLSGIAPSENRQTIATSICAVKAHLPDPAKREMKSTWSAAMQAVTNTLTAELTKLFSQLNAGLVSATSGKKGDILPSQINTDVQGLIPQVSALQLQLSTNDSAAVSDQNLCGHISCGTITKFRTETHTVKGGRKYGIAGPRKKHHYQVTVPYDVPSYRPNVGAVQGAFRVLSTAWMTKFQANVTTEINRVSKGASLKAEQAIRVALEKPLKEARERLRKGREEVECSKAVLAELAEKALKVQKSTEEITEKLKSML